MLVHIPQVLDTETLAQARSRLREAPWIDGRVTAGHQGVSVKHNQQLPEDAPLAVELGDRILAALERNPLFISAALPNRVYPPLFNRYAPGMTFGSHIDNAIRLLPGSPLKIRTDLSATLFLSEPEEYAGGELLIEDTYGAHSIKLPAGDLILYPASSVHRVNPVQSGVRLAGFFWTQSLIRDDGQRRTLFELDRAIQRLRASGADAQACIELSGCYHNLLRQWSTP